MFPMMRDNRLTKGISYSPPTGNSAADCAVTNTKIITPFSSGFCDPANSDNTVLSGVVCLLFVSGPAAVFRGIVSIVIDSFNRMLAAWALAHIFQERRVGIKPAVTHTNTSATIVFIACAVFVITSCFNSSPAPILSAFFKPVSGVSFNDSIRNTAATSGSMAGAQITALNDCCLSAITQTFPCSALVFITPGTRNYNELPESLASEVEHCHVTIPQYEYSKRIIS